MKRIKTDIFKVNREGWLRGFRGIKILDFLYDEDLSLFQIEEYNSKIIHGKKNILKKTHCVTVSEIHEAITIYDELCSQALKINYSLISDGAELEIVGFDTGNSVQEKINYNSLDLPRKLSV